MIADSQTALALLEYICRHPGEDAVRLAYADVLDDHGEEARAELIRVQVALANYPRAPTGLSDGFTSARWKERRDTLRRRERELLDRPHGWLSLPAPLVVSNRWYWDQGRIRVANTNHAYILHRGFPAEITLTTEAFVGGPCGRCEAGGALGRTLYTCPDCRGTGRTPGHAAALFHAAPIVAVKLSDREPWNPGTGENRWWFNRDRNDTEPPPPWTLPDELFALLEGYHPLPSGLNHKRYDNDQHAHGALAATVLLYGRRQGWPCPECKSKDHLLATSGYACFVCHGTGHTVT